MALVADDGTGAHYGGHIRFVDQQGQTIADGLDPWDDDGIAEAVEPAYLKSPYYRPLGYPDGMYRVGPLARLNVCRRLGTPKADLEWRIPGTHRPGGQLFLLLPLCQAD